MNQARLASMATHAVAFDLETHLIQPGLATPPPVCGSVAEPGAEVFALRGALLPVDSARVFFEELLRDDTAVICGAKIAYDMCVMAVDAARRGVDLMPAIFAAYDRDRTVLRGYVDGRVFDVQLAEALHAIAQGQLGKDPRTGKGFGDGSSDDDDGGARYSLQRVVDFVLGRLDAKVNDRFRMKYAELERVPLERWPLEARTYPVDDAINTLEAALAQAGHRPARHDHDWREEGQATICQSCRMPLTLSGPGPDCFVRRPRRNLNDLSRQCYAGFALDLSATWGFRIDQVAVDALVAKYTAASERDKAKFVAPGIIREDGTENQSVLKKLVAVAYGCTEACAACGGTGKVPSEKTGGKTKVNCADCNGTALRLTPAVPRTETGQVAKGRDALQESADELLMDYEDWSVGAGRKIMTTYVPLVRGGRACLRCGKSGAGKKPHADGCDEPGYREIPLLPRPNTLVETGRCAYKKGLHGLPRRGGIRECIVARDGFVFSSEDFASGELVTLAQSCIWMVGYSKLAEALNLGLDAHLALAGTMTGRDYARMAELKKSAPKEIDGVRQSAKKANFGFGGGMAELTFVLRRRADPDCWTPCPAGPDERGDLRGFRGLRTCVLIDNEPYCGNHKITFYNDRMCPPVCEGCVLSAKRLRDAWFKQWPEMREFFAVVKRAIAVDGPSGTPEVVQHVSKRVRGGVGFCDAANGYFQGLLSDAAKDAYCQVVRECYDRTCRVESSEHMTSAYAGLPSPLFGSRAILLAHDEVIAEHPEGEAHDGATRISEIMVESLRFKCPDLARACKADPTLMRRLYKGAEEVRDGNGRLVPWEPRAAA